MGKEVRITLYQNARLNPQGIPMLMQKYRRGLSFKPDTEPKFILIPQGNLIHALKDFVQELLKLVEE